MFTWKGKGVAKRQTPSIPKSTKEKEPELIIEVDHDFEVTHSPR